MMINRRFLSGIVPLTMLTLMLCGCAKENTTSDIEIEKQEFESWLSVNYPNAVSSGRGVYIIEDTPGTGTAVYDDVYLSVNYTMVDTDGNIGKTTDENMAKQLGTYNKSYFYNSTIMYYGTGSTYAGVYDAIKGMKVGGTRKFISPTWLNRSDDYSTEEKYISKYNSEDCNETMIITLTLLELIPDIQKYEVDSLESYVSRHLDGVDSTFYGYYYKQLVAPADTTSLSDTTIYINYIGRRLDGQVFDTTIADTAKFYNIYSSGKTYEPVEVTIGESVDDVTLSSSSVIEGFSYCLYHMKTYEKGVCAFISDYGYTYSGSGSTIPAYSPLQFEIELVDEP